MYEESLLEPMGEISYEDRENTKAQYSSTVSSLTKTDDKGDDIEPSKHAHSKEINATSRVKKSTELPSELNDSNCVIDAAKKHSELDEDNSNISQSEELKAQHPRLVPIDKLIRKSLLPNATQKGNAKNDKSNTTEIGIDRNKKPEENESRSEKDVIDLNDYLEVQSDSPLDIQETSPNDMQDNANDDQDLLQPMTEVPYTEDENPRSQPRIKTKNSTLRFDEDNFTNSADEFSESSSSEAYSEIESSDSESSNSSSKKKRRKKSLKVMKIPEPLPPTKNAGKRLLPKISYDESSNDKTQTKKTATIPKGRKIVTQPKRGNSSGIVFMNETQHETSHPDNAQSNSNLSEIDSASTTKMFGRQKNNFKIDSESGGQIVFQNNELTLVNKTSKAKLDVVEDRHASSTTVSQDSFDESKAKALTSDVDILPIVSHRVKDANPPLKSSNNSNSKSSQLVASSVSEHETTIKISKVTNEPLAIAKVVATSAATLAATPAATLTTTSASTSATTSSAAASATTATTSTTIKNSESIGVEKRFKRQTSALKPTYYEWSESSMDQLDVVVNEKVIGKHRKPHWKTLQKQKQMRKEGYNNWRAQLKVKPNNPFNTGIDPMARQLGEKHGQATSLDKSNAPTGLQKIKQPSSDLTPAMENGQSSAHQQGSMEIDNSNITDQTLDTTNNTIDTSTGAGMTPTDDPSALIGRKRIRKLKYGSYNFSEKRDQSKPKMVLKYKKRYKRKKQVPSIPEALSSMSGLLPDITKMLALSGVTCTPQEQLNVTSASLPTEALPGEMPAKKKPGPKKGWKRALVEANKLAAALSNQQAKRKLQKPNLLDKTLTRNASKQDLVKTMKTDEETASTSTITQAKEGLKHKRKISEAATASSSDGDDENAMKKRLRRKKRKDEEQPSNRVYLENYNQVLQDRNKVLLEILEQRSAEIRDLKLRVSNLVKNDDRPTDSEKKCEPDGSWSNVELGKAYSLQKLSKPFYKYVQQRFALPLPQQYDIDKFIAGIRVTKGIIKDVMDVLECDGDIMNDMERVTVLQISKIETAAIFEYDRTSDSILGKYNEMTVIVAKGLYGGWNQAVYVGFDIVSVKDNLLEVIKQLHKFKFSVVACVCNYNENQADIWKELDVSMGCNYFAHPITADFIYAFYYIDDILCAIRHHFISEGFTLDMKTINASPLSQLIQEKSGLIPITSATLSTEIKESDLLKHSMDLFSRETVKLIHLCLPSNDLNLNCANFIDIISSFYCLMNTCESAINENNTGMGHGRLLEDQSQILGEVQLNFYRLKCPGIERMSEFQKATMMTIESTKMLQHSMKQKHKIEYFAMKHITNDFLKSRMKHYTTSHSIVTKTTPLRALNFIKQIFFDGSCNDHQDDDMYKLWLNVPIEKNLAESHYVQLLLEWIIEQHKIKHPFSAVSQEDLMRRFQKFEETFQTMQNPLFEICEGSFAKVLKKLKAHTFGMSLDMLQTFVIQRHLLRIKYNNSIGVKAEPC